MPKLIIDKEELEKIRERVREARHAVSDDRPFEGINIMIEVMRQITDKITAQEEMHTWEDIVKRCRESSFHQDSEEEYKKDYRNAHRNAQELFLHGASHATILGILHAFTGWPLPEEEEQKQQTNGG